MTVMSVQGSCDMAGDRGVLFLSERACGMAKKILPVLLHGVHSDDAQHPKRRHRTDMSVVMPVPLRVKNGSSF
jgi:hypothetical protein